MIDWIEEPRQIRTNRGALHDDERMTGAFGERYVPGRGRECMRKSTRKVSLAGLVHGDRSKVRQHVCPRSAGLLID